MNQVTQYLQDRLGVIKFFFDRLLETGGSFYVNIVSDGFLHGRISESMVVEALDQLWVSAPGVSLQKGKVAMGRKLTYQYRLRKTSDDARLPVPTFKYSQDDRITESLIFVKSAYDFREIRE